MDEPKVVAVIGARGGCGGTTLTVNLTAELSATRSVCATDIDFGRGDISGLLNLSPKVSIPKLLTEVLDSAKLKGSALQYQPGCHFLAQPVALSELVRPSREEVTRLIEVARETWDLVLADCGNRVDDSMLAAMKVADRVLVVATPDVLAIQNVVRLNALLREVGVPDERWWLVLNKVPRRPHLPIADIEALLKMRVSATLSRDEGVCNEAATQGKLVRDVSRSSSLSRDFSLLWDRLNNKSMPVPVWKFW